MIILDHHFVAILLAKMLIWAPFSQSRCTIFFCINPCVSKLHKKIESMKGNMVSLQAFQTYETHNVMKPNMK